MQFRVLRCIFASCRAGGRKYGKPIIFLNEKIFRRKRFSLKRRRNGATLPFCAAKRLKAEFAATRKPAFGLLAANRK